MMIDLFEKYTSNRYAYQQDLYDLVKKDIDNVVHQLYGIDDSLFGLKGAEIKMLLQSDEAFFWSTWDYLEKMNHYDENNSKYVCDLKKKGIIVLEEFLNSDENNSLLHAWHESLSSIPENSSETELNMLKYRFHFEKKEGIGYAVGSEFDGKKRVMYYDNTLLPSYARILLADNHFFNELVREYYGLLREVSPSTIMMEHLFPPKIERNDVFWHIDNLTDQMKVMIVLEDMDVDSGPFTYIEKTHKVADEYKNRYHKMYSMNGMTTQEHNHFESSFTRVENAKKGVLKAGSVVIFDCKIHHTAMFPQNSGNRKNIILYYTGIPTAKNKFLLKIDSFLNFGLR